MRKTKIIATIGPSSHSVEIVRDLIDNGADSIRLNFSHGTWEDKEEAIKWIREYEEERDIYIPIIGDLQGSAVRIGDIDRIDVVKGVTYLFTYDGEGIPVRCREVFDVVETGDTVLVDDGRLIFRAVEVGEGYFRGEALLSGELGARKTFLIRSKDIDLPPIRDKDVDDLRFCIEKNLDYVALSFVRDRSDIEKLRKLISKYGGIQGVLAKIERPQAVENIDGIIEASDGVIVARGDLGLYYGLEEIPVIQSGIVEKSISLGKLTIVATQILDSMKENPQPTRAEVIDIYNAVGEGVDAIMLTGETAVGKYPVETVNWASKVLSRADEFSRPRYQGQMESIYDKFAKGVLMLAESIGGKVIGYSKGGNTAMRISRYRPLETAFIAVSRAEVARKVNIRYGIKPLLVSGDHQEAFKGAVKALKKMGFLKQGDIAIFMGGLRERATDMVRVEVIT